MAHTLNIPRNADGSIDFDRVDAYAIPTEVLEQMLASDEYRQWRDEIDAACECGRGEMTVEEWQKEHGDLPF